MKVAKDTFLIQVDSDRNAHVGVTGANGQKILIDVDYNKYKHTRQIGHVYACPIRITDQYAYDTPLNVGDTVLFHHFVCQPDHKVPFMNGVYRAEYFHLYAKMVFGGTICLDTGKHTRMELLRPLEDAIFVVPIQEDESALYKGSIRIKTHQENIKQQGIVFASSKKAQAANILSGDKVFFTANAEYPIRVLDKDMYRMRIRNIVAVERNGQLVPIAGKVLVKKDSDNHKFGSFYEAKENSQSTGIVVAVGKDVDGVEVGERISYYTATAKPLIHNGDQYSFIELRHINYALQ